VRRALLLFVVLGALTLTASLPALTQEGETQGEDQYESLTQEVEQGAAQYEQGAGETQYDAGAGELQYEEQGAAEAGCGWYWGYRWYTAGAWEWWCWDPQMGWWYATDETGTKQFARFSGPGSFINVLR